jgi:aryl-alcohol dehydrogenase-like predicted oxidoreductase
MAEFVLGSVQLGLAYGAANRTGKPSRESARALVRRAVAGGVHRFDTARAYGDAEERLGEALSGQPVSIVTKLSPLSELAEDAWAEAAVAAAEASVAQSLAALRTDRLDCLLLHRALHMTAFGGAIWQRLKDFVAAGTIGRLGVSVQSPAELEEALARPEVQHVQMPFNMLDWRWDGLIDRLTARTDVVVHVRSVFLQGLLACGDPALWPAVDGVDAAAVLRTIGWLVKDLDREDAADLCLAYVRGLDFIDGVVVGLETEAQLDRNLRLWLKPPLTIGERERVDTWLPRVPEQLLNPALWPKK